MKAFYIKLTDRLTNEEAISFFTEKSVPAVQQVDLYRGQYLYEQEFDLLRLPAVLLEHTINHQARTSTITLHCVWEQTGTTENISADRDRALQYLDWLDAVYDLAYNMESQNTGKLNLISEGTQQDETPTLVHLLTFECSYMGRVKQAGDKVNYAEGNEVTAEGGIKAPEADPPAPPGYNFG